MANDRTNDDEGPWIEAALRGDRAARERLFQHYRSRLRQAVTLRLPPRLAARVDPSDIVQETLVEASRQFDQYLRARRIAFYPWLRRLATDQLALAARRHLGVQARAADREVMHLDDLKDSSWQTLADCLASSVTGPLVRLVHEEARQRVLQALTGLPDIDREVLVLRFLEELTITESAEVLDISESALKMRQLRALRKLQDSLATEE